MSSHTNRVTDPLVRFGKSKGVGGGILCGRPVTNLGVRQGEQVITAARGVLEGVTRRTILELLDREGIEVRLQALPAATARGVTTSGLGLSKRSARIASSTCSSRSRPQSQIR